MAEEIEELLVKIRPDGVDETASGLENVQSQFSRTTETVEESTGVLEQFSQRWRGAVGVIVGALLTATAGLLSKVPVVNELMGGLMAVVDALAYRLSSFLRPTLGPINRALYRLAPTIYTVEGAIGKLLDTVMASFLGILGYVAILNTAWQEDWHGIRTTTNTVLSAIRSAISRFIGFVKPYIEKFLDQVLNGNWKGALKTLAAFHQAVFKRIRSLALKFVAAFAKTVVGFTSTVRTTLEKFWATVRTGFETLFNLIVNQAKSWANTFVSVVENAVNRAIRAVPDSIQSKLGLEQVSLGKAYDVQSPSDIMAKGQRQLEQRRAQAEIRGIQRESEAKSQIDRLISAMQNSQQKTTINMDGRQVAESVEPYLGQGAAGAGRTGSR